jgi:hypothetical protein
MWLRSQEHGLWPERSPEPDQAALEIRKDLRNRAPQLGSRPTLLSRSAAELSALDDSSFGRKTAAEGSDNLAHPFKPTALDDFFPDDARSSNSLEIDTADHLSDELSGHLSRDPISDDLSDGDPATSDGTPKSLLQRLADLSVTVRFHRADLYLGVSLFVAVLALLWPAAAAPRHAALGPWERALITLGIAEAPAPPVVRLQGDPGIQVWVDTHSALYYCPGEELYGKTADGHVTSQREAQMDRFQPAGRSVCD